MSVRSGAGEECHVLWYVLECGVRTRHGVWNVHSVWCVYVCVCPCVHACILLLHAFSGTLSLDLLTFWSTTER